MKVFYAVRYNEEWSWDNGSTRKKDAIKYANSIDSKEIAILDITDEYNAFCIGELEKIEGVWVDSRNETRIY